MPNAPAPLFIRPLLDTEDKWSGYAVEFEPGAPVPEAIAHLCGSPWLREFDVRKPWFLPVQPGCELSGMPERAVLVFAAAPDATEDPALAQCEARLRQASRRLALCAAPQAKLPASGTWNYLLISSAHARTLPPYTLLGLSARTTIVATQVFSYQDRQWCQKNSCALSTDEYLLTFSADNRRPDTTRLKLLELLSLVAKDADTRALEDVFRQEPKLSYSLLRLVNSAAMAPRTPITSFSQAINLLGRRQLQRWLQLLVYADPNHEQQGNPLLLKAAARGRLLELLAPGLGSLAGELSGDAAFMTGSFSLLDVLLNMPMPEILQQLPLHDDVREALAARSGPLGKLLNAIDLAEAGTPKSAAQKLAELGIGGDAYIDAQLQALGWAAKIHPAAG
jgi:hypothetical protein